SVSLSVDDFEAVIHNGLNNNVIFVGMRVTYLNAGYKSEAQCLFQGIRVQMVKSLEYLDPGGVLPGRTAKETARGGAASWKRPWWTGFGGPSTRPARLTIASFSLWATQAVGKHPRCASCPP